MVRPQAAGPCGHAGQNLVARAGSKHIAGCLEAVPSDLQASAAKPDLSAGPHLDTLGRLAQATLRLPLPAAMHKTGGCKHQRA
jgi:hypothetical protein